MGTPHGLTAARSQPPARLNGHSRETFLYVLGLAIEEGCTLTEAVEMEPGLPAVRTIYSAAVRDPEVGAAMAQYRQTRAFNLDQEIEDMAAQLADLSFPMSATEVRRYEVATKSKQWLAAHRFPQIFGERTPQQPTMSVVINTNLPMGDETVNPGIFEIRAEVPTPRVIEGEWEEQPEEEERDG